MQQPVRGNHAGVRRLFANLCHHVSQSHKPDGLGHDCLKNIATISMDMSKHFRFFSLDMDNFTAGRCKGEGMQAKQRADKTKTVYGTNNLGLSAKLSAKRFSSFHASPGGFENS